MIGSMNLLRCWRPESVSALLPVLVAVAFLGCEEKNGPTGPPLEGEPVLLWVQSGASHRSDSLVTDGERVFISSPGDVIVLDAGTGDLLWEFDASIVGFVTPSLVRAGEVVAISWRGVLHGWRARDGAELWSNDQIPTRWTGIEGEGYPTDIVRSDGADDLYVATEDELARIDPTTGEILWRREPEGTGSLGLVAGSSAVCTRRSPVVTVACYAESDGRLLWSVGQLEISSRGGIEVVEDMVVVEAGDWFGLQLSSGEQVWRRSGITASLAEAAEAVGFLYACTFRADCVAIRASDGAEIWRHAVGAGSPPAASDDFVFVLGSTGSGKMDLHILDASSGDPVDVIRSEENTSFSRRPAYGDGRVFVMSFNDIRAYRYP